MRDLFEQLAANHVRPVREFVIDLRWGEASREWLVARASAVDSLHLGIAEARPAGARRRARSAIRPRPAAQARRIGRIERDHPDGAARDRILLAYERLVEVLPKAFALDMDRAQRESLIVQSLLCKFPR